MTTPMQRSAARKMGKTIQVAHLEAALHGYNAGRRSANVGGAMRRAAVAVPMKRTVQAQSVLKPMKSAAARKTSKSRAL